MEVEKLKVASLIYKKLLNCESLEHLALPFTHKPIDKNSIHPEAEILRT